MSQEKLGEGLGLSFQQVQKYEQGRNRISVSRLVEIARILDVPASILMDADSSETQVIATSPDIAQLVAAAEALPPNVRKKGLLSLVRAFNDEEPGNKKPGRA